MHSQTSFLNQLSIWITFILKTYLSILTIRSFIQMFGSLKKICYWLKWKVIWWKKSKIRSGKLFDWKIKIIHILFFTIIFFNLKHQLFLSKDSGIPSKNSKIVCKFFWMNGKIYLWVNNLKWKTLKDYD